MAKKTEDKLRRYILMPDPALPGAALPATALPDTAMLDTAMLDAGAGHPGLRHAMFTLSNYAVRIEARAAAAAPPQMRVLDTIGENGPKLVEMPAEGELSLRLSVPGVKIVPEVFYERLWNRPQIEARLPRKAKPVRGAAMLATRMTVAPAPAPSAVVTVVARATGQPIAGASVVAFTDFAARAGDSATTDAAGRAVLLRLSPRQTLERVYVYPPPGWWDYLALDTTVAAVGTVELGAVDPVDAGLLLRQLYGTLPATAGDGVTIAIVDSGIDAGHPDLKNTSGGANCVSDETRNDPQAKNNWRPALSNGEHGTHVAGIAAGRGGADGFRGLAPAATLRAYRVFPDAGGPASNFDIASAISQAVSDQCDVINLSLGGGPKDDLLQDAIAKALAAGVIVVAASGNDSRKPVAFPASLAECVCVSAMGRRATFPKAAIGSGDVAAPNGGKDNKDFVGEFSNIGPEVDVTGPGVAIVSTLPGGSYGPLSGTSMAAPAVTGFVAYLLSENPALKQLAGVERSRQLKDLLYNRCVPEQFGREFEGFGLPSA